MSEIKRKGFHATCAGVKLVTAARNAHDEYGYCSGA